MDIVRVGVVSSVESDGTVRIYYEDRDQTTAPMQLFAGQQEYAALSVGEQVIVLHLSNDTSSGVVLGGVWGLGNPPPSNVDYQKNFGGGAYLKCEKGRVTLYGTEVYLGTPKGKRSLSELLNLEERIKRLEERE